MQEPEGKRSAGRDGLVAYVAAAVAVAVPLGLMLPPLAAALTLGFWLAVLVVVRSDLASFTIPDEASAAIALLGLGAAAAGGGGAIEPVGIALAHGAGAFAVIWAVRHLHARFSGREGIGFGDVKLAGALGIWLDLAGQALALQLAALAALLLVLLMRRRTDVGRDTALPFGAFLAPAGFGVHAWTLVAPEWSAWSP